MNLNVNLKSIGRRWGKPQSALDLSGSVVVWLRHELRLRDNPLLQRALELSPKPVLAYCWDTEFHAKVTPFGSPKAGPLRQRFIEECLLDLKQNLEKIGGRLVVFAQSPQEALPLLVAEGATVLVTGLHCPEERLAEQKVREALALKGVKLEVFDPAGITDLLGPAELQHVGLPDDPMEFPENFQEFYLPTRPFLLDLCQAGLHPAPQLLSAPELPELPEMELAVTPCEDYTYEFQGGESAAWERLTIWLSNGLHGYKHSFRNLAGDCSSRLSAHLAYGCLSVQRLLLEVLGQMPKDSPSVHVEHFIYELCWREFFRKLAVRWGPRLFQVQGPLQLQKPWIRNAELERRWKSGATGVPLVDAAMRELQQTGYMGNLSRQITAAFLVEELQLDWRVGADWFEAHLLDYDVHSNWGQWARSAGVAPVNDAKKERMGSYRYYDLAMQQKGAKQYIRNWVPELDEFLDEDLFAPWRAFTLMASPVRAFHVRIHDTLASHALQRHLESHGNKSDRKVKATRRGRVLSGNA
ncbi:unnamed protein product [Effrenium voratum]|nr:unnamed protein product [Effrenium voratum]